MAKLVGVFGAPHRPSLPQEVSQAPGKLEAEALLKEVREQLEEAAPQAIIEIATDHFTNFWYHNMPAFCVGLIEDAPGPERSTQMPHYTVQGHPALGRALLAHVLEANFDLSSAQELLLDHSIMVPLYFLTPSMDLPVVPLYTNGIAPPFPKAQRCLALGKAVRFFVDGWPGHDRVALVVSGSFALEVGGPKVGWTDQEWVDTVRGRLERADYEGLVASATQERMAAAGNASGELLNWITAMGAVGDARPVSIKTDDNGNGYGVWRL